METVHGMYVRVVVFSTDPNIARALYALSWCRSVLGARVSRQCAVCARACGRAAAGRVEQRRAEQRRLAPLQHRVQAGQPLLGLERGRAAGYGAGATADEAEEEVVGAVLPLFEAGWRERWVGSGGGGDGGDGGGGATEGGSGGGGDGLALPRAMALNGRIFSAADVSGGATSAAAARAALRASPGNDSSSDYSRQSLR